MIYGLVVTHAMSEITSFPSDGYDGVVIERNIPH